MMLFKNHNFCVAWISLIIVADYCLGEKAVSGLDIADKQELPIVLLGHGEVTVHLVFGPRYVAPNLTATLGNLTQLDTSAAVIDHYARNISYTIRFSFLDNVDFGTYNLTFSLTSASHVLDIKIVTFIYEEPITGFDVLIKRFVPVEEEQIFTVTMSNGSNVEITWLLENVTYRPKHFKSPRIVSSTFNFTTSGQHNVTIFAENYVSRNVRSFNITAYYRLNGFQVKIENSTVSTTDNAVFIILLSNSSQFPMGSISANIFFGDGNFSTLSLNEHIDQMQTLGYFLPYQYKLSGNYMANMSIHTEIDSITFESFDIKSWEKGVTKFDSIPAGMEVVYMLPGENVTFRFLYDTGGASVNFSAAINTGKSLDTSLSQLNESTKEIVYTLEHPFMRNEGYGTYTLDFLLTPSIGNGKTKQIILHYEEPITSFKVVGDAILPVNEQVYFNVSLMTGSNTKTEFWIHSSNEKMYFHHKGAPKYFQMNVTFSLPEEQNVTIRISNTVSSANVSLRVTTYYKLNRLNVRTNASLIETTDTVVFSIRLMENANLPMGHVNFTTSVGDGNAPKLLHQNESRDIMSGKDYVLYHQYSSQGNYTAEFVISSEIDKSVYIFNICVWDKLEVKIETSHVGKVFDELNFTFVNPPSTEFAYNISYGDGNVRSRNESVWLNAYEDTAWKHAYNDDGVYQIIFYAWNGFYSLSDSLSIIIQYPILQEKVTLSPSFFVIPIPDGKASFQLTLVEDGPIPSNVSCLFDFEDNYELDSEVQLIFLSPVNKTFIYTFPGTKEVNFTCWNKVSVMTKLSNITVKKFKLEDFSITYQSPINMNTTLSTETNDKYRDDTPVQKVHHTVAYATFHVDLLGCSKLPPDIYFTWDFGDHTVEKGLVSFEKAHAYAIRNKYDIKVTILNKITNETFVKGLFSITIGIIQFSVDPLEGIVSLTEFTFKFSGLAGNVTYIFKPEPQLSETSYILTNHSLQYVFSNRGLFQSSVFADNGSVSEIVYLEMPVEVDYNLSSIGVSVSNGSVDTYTIHLPPGYVKITISVKKYVTMPYTTCAIIIGDLINDGIFRFFGNLTHQEPFILEQPYYTLGNHTLEVNCSNHASNFTFKHTVNVMNECFTNDGIFDRQYSHSNSPLKTFSFMNTDLSTRMGVLCVDMNPGFSWSVQRVIVNKSKEHEIPLDYKVTKNRGVARFGRGDFSQDILRVVLNVSLDGTWIHEFTYLEFIKSPPFAYIVGGNKRTVKYLERTVTIDALTESFATEKGRGANKDLEFVWDCRTGKVTFDLYQMFDDQDAHSTGCHLDDKGRGIKLLNLSLGTYTETYVVNVMVIYGELNSTFTQLIKVQLEDPPSITVRCKINCKEKVAIHSPIIMTADCDDCKADEKVFYLWSLWQYKEGISFQILNFEKNTRGTMNQSIYIGENCLEEGGIYVLKVEVTSSLAARNGSTVVAVDLTANYPPYGGYCVIDKWIYYIPNDTVNIKCKGFADEGLRPYQNYTADIAYKEPLSYIYETKTRKIHYNTIGEEDIFTELQKSGESSVINLPLQMGEEALNYSVDMRVLVSDRFGDVAVYTFNITVKPDERMLPQLGYNFSSVEIMLHGSKSKLDIINAGGNDMAVVRNSGSLASVIASVMHNGSLNEEKSKMVKSMFRKNMEYIMKTMTAAVLTENEEAKQMSISDSQQVSRNLEAVFRNPDYVTRNVTSHGSKVCAAIANKVYQSIKNVRPFPVEDYRSITGSIHGVIATADKILNNLMPARIVDVLHEFSESEIYETLKKEQDEPLSHQTNYTDTDERNDAELQREARRLYNLKQLQREEMIEKASQAEESVPKLLDTIAAAYDVKLLLTEIGTGPSRITRENIAISVEKVTAEILQNRTENAMRGIFIGFDQNDTDSIEGTLHIKQGIFNKPPTIYGHDVASITSRVLQLDLSNNSLAPRMSFTNPNYASARHVEPVYSPGDPERMFYLSFEVLNDGDVALIYIQPENFDIFHAQTLTLYDLYLGDGTLPKSSVNAFKHTFSIRDWESDNGFKVMLPEMNKGRKYLGIKPHQDPVFSQSKRRKKRSVEGRTRMESMLNSSMNETTTKDSFDTSSLQPCSDCINDTVRATDASKNNSAFKSVTANFSIIIVTTGCRSWNEAEMKWTPDGCMVLPMTTMNETVCRCPQPTGNLFATTFYVPPNKIDFRTVFSKFDAMNAAVYGTCIGILVLWVITGILLRRQDKKDQERWRTHLLCDTDASDAYFYMISVHTYLWRRSGTKSQVYFVLSGDKDDSGVRILSDGEQTGFPTGSVRSFFMGTKYDLGDLMLMRIWHDNSGTGNEQSWYLNKIIIDDLQKRKRFTFECQQWLASDEADGEVERILSVHSDKDNQKFNTLFFQQAEINITENHLWFSTIFRSQKSNFTRVQRLSCIVALLFLTMISNAMFFHTSETEVPIRIGMFQFSTTTVFVSLIGILISTVPVLLVSVIFRNTRTKCMDQKKNVYHDDSMRDRIKSLPQTDRNLNKLEDTKTGQPLPLPHTMAYISWILIFCSVGASAFFLILYSMQWGKPKSEEWVVSIFFSFTESIIIMDPLKVVVIAFVFAIIFKSQTDESCPVINLERLKGAVQEFDSKSKRALITLWNDITLENSKKEKVEMFRKRRKEEVKAKKAMTRLLMYLGYMLILYSISYVNRDQRAFLLKSNVDKHLYTHSKFHIGFSYIIDKKMWITWLNETFIPTFYPLTHYNGQNLKTVGRKLFGDMDSVRVGPARLRQVRMSNAKCMTSMFTGLYPCVDPYDQYKEERTDYCLGWTTYNATVCDTPVFKRAFFTGNAWKYTYAEDIWGIPVSGQYAIYSGGGYILTFDKDRQQAHALLNEVVRYTWIDRRTRAIFVEFTLYNGNVDLFIYVQYLAEFTELGGSMTWIDSQSFRPVPKLSQAGAYSLVCYFFFCVFLVCRTVKSIIKFRKHVCRKFCSMPWNLVDLLCILLSYCLIISYGFRMRYSDKAMGMFYDNIGTGKSSFINFQHIVVWDNVFNILLAVLIFIDTIRILRILGYNKRFADVANVVSHASRELLGFGFLVGILYTDYACLGNLLFGKTLKEYRSFFTAWASLTNALIGKNKVDELLAVAPQIAQVYYFTYVFCIIMILGTVFAAILNFSISEVRGESLKESETLGISDIVAQAFCNIFGSFFHQRKRGNQRKHYMINPDTSRFDTFNILQLVRGTFQEYDTESNKNDTEEEDPHSRVTNCDIYIEKQTKPSQRQNEEPVSLNDDDLLYFVEDDEFKKTPKKNVYF